MFTPGPGIIIWAAGGPWDYYLGVWGPKITLKISSVYRSAGISAGSVKPNRTVAASPHLIMLSVSDSFCCPLRKTSRATRFSLYLGKIIQGEGGQ